jgi:predicted ATPase/DNA-binding SARP family transcriptional activator
MRSQAITQGREGEAVSEPASRREMRSEQCCLSDVVVQDGVLTPGVVLAEQVHVLLDRRCRWLLRQSWAGAIAGRSQSDRSADSYGSAVELRVLGDLAVVDGSRLIELRPVERRLVAALVAARPSGLRHDALAEAVWGEQAPPSAKHSLQAHVRRIRVVAGPDLIATSSGGYRIGENVVVDADTFEAAIGRATSTDAPEALAAWDHALSLWRGTPFDDLEDWPPATTERARMVELWYRAAEEHCAAALGESPGAEVVAEAERLAQAEPLRERRWALLMSALSATGRRAEALRTFDRARRTLATELGISPGHELTRLHEELLREGDEPDHWLATRRGHGKLPAALTSLVGREVQLDLLDRLLSEGRLVTLTGPGGVGKTRLALEYASQRSTEVSGGVWWVELAATREPATIEQLIVTTLGITAGTAASARERIVDAIGDREMLLVLDNCEHVLAAVGVFAADVLAGCARLRVLATSREPLAVAGERPLAVPALPVDGAGVELFVARAREADPSFIADDADALDAISRRLDGVPLAIELAAARVRTLGISELAARLDERFDLVTAERRGPDDRHSTMRAALDWSYHLLSTDERVVFEQFAVFRGRFELEAVERIARRLPAQDVAAVVASLVDKSMVLAGPGPARFRMLEPLRQYAGERLRARGDLDATAILHAAYYAELATRLNSELGGRREIELSRRLDAARDNLRAAFHTAVDHGDAATALTIPAQVSRYAQVHVWSEPWDWSVTALDVPGASTHPLRPAALLTASGGAWQRGNPTAAVALAEMVIGLVEPGSELWREAHRMKAAALVWLGRFDDASSAATTAVTGQATELTYGSLTRIATLALIGNAIGRPDPAMARQLLDDAKTLGNPTSLALAWHTAGVILGRHAPALNVEYQREAVRIAAAAGATLIEGFALAVLAAAAADDDPLDGARTHLDVMRHYLRAGNRTHLRSFGRGLIHPLVQLDAYEAAAIVDGATRDQPELGPLAASRAASTTQVRDALGPAYDTAANRGARMTDDELVAYLEDTIVRISPPAHTQRIAQ